MGDRDRSSRPGAAGGGTLSEPVLLAEEFPDLVEGVAPGELRRVTAASAAAVAWHRPGPWDPPVMATVVLGDPPPELTAMHAASAGHGLPPP